MQEEWRPVVGYYELYDVSNYGRVRRATPSRRYSMHRIMSERYDSGGYARVHLSKNCCAKWVSVHRIVSQAFIGACQNGFEVNHIDGNKKNNCYGNLEYVSRSENMKHAFDLGLFSNRAGEGNNNHKLADLDVIKIKNILLLGTKTHKEISEMFGVSRPTISRISRGEAWAHVNIKENYVRS